MKYIVSVSGGKGSYEALRRCIEQKGRDNTVGVFADVGRIERDGETVCGEDDDLYRFLDDIERSLDFPIQRIKSEKYTDIWDVFFKTRMMGSSLRDPCSRWMKAKGYSRMAGWELRTSKTRSQCLGGAMDVRRGEGAGVPRVFGANRYSHFQKKQ